MILHGTLAYTLPWYASDIEGKFDEAMLTRSLLQKKQGLQRMARPLRLRGLQKLAQNQKNPSQKSKDCNRKYQFRVYRLCVRGREPYRDSYLVTKGNENNISLWKIEWRMG